jgi:short-subunit dehydrogenase
LATFTERGTGLIVNIGSAFGAIGHPGYAAYSASKFGLRGFTEALYRELAGTGVRAIYVGPRAVATAMNAGRAGTLNVALETNVDQPAEVARTIARAMQAGRPRTHMGWPERALVRLNQLAPSLIDRAISRQLPLIRATLANEPCFRPSIETQESL